MHCMFKLFLMDSSGIIPHLLLVIKYMSTNLTVSCVIKSISRSAFKILQMLRVPEQLVNNQCVSFVLRKPFFLEVGVYI